ncbi:hypothetical protein HaLaN_13953 [Haematococcus lacustris]|uniref:Uncharacterized protein n=1 Tax=Haematococcus lacustris TaxID=44745 RepID=A0A699Z7A0_HAELA|nr:hypothetical protein HaLaN_13953 [Haematococcus lacustris]
MPAQVLGPLQPNNARSEGLNGTPSADRYAPPPCMPPHCSCPRTIGVPALPACDQSPGWRCAARLQEDPPQATGPFPAAGRHPFSAPRNRVTVCAQDIGEVGLEAELCIQAGGGDVTHPKGTLPKGTRTFSVNHSLPARPTDRVLSPSPPSLAEGCMLPWWLAIGFMRLGHALEATRLMDWYE